MTELEEFLDGINALMISHQINPEGPPRDYLNLVRVVLRDFYLDVKFDHKGAKYSVNISWR